MRRILVPRIGRLALGATVVLVAVSCKHDVQDTALSNTQPVVRSVPAPAENGPQLGAISELVSVYAATDPGLGVLGTLRPGARLARSVEPVSRARCEAGWYAIAPRGFVCTGVQATLDLTHPTLAAMALQPDVAANLPYTYARTRLETPLWSREPSREDAVREVGKLRRRAGVAVVGSWKAKEPNGTETRLALLTSGRFVRADELEAAKPSEFAGVELGKSAELPFGFVVKRGVRTFRLSGNDAEKGELLEYHAQLPLSGRFRSLGEVKYWALGKGASAAPERWVRHRDLTVIQKRSTFPDFLNDDTHWLDISVTTGTLVAYVGKQAVFATLLSVARELGSGDTGPASDGSRAIPLGTFSVTKKHLTLTGKDTLDFGESFEVHDVPWALTLSSGQLIHGAYWHDRFGIEQGAGSMALSPADAARLFHFVAPKLPKNWHSATARAEEPGTPVVVRK